MKGGSSCFVCDGDVEGGRPVTECRTPWSGSSVAGLLSQLVGEQFLVLVGEEDSLCSPCQATLGLIDKIGLDLANIRTALLGYISNKYNIDQFEEGGEASELKLFSCEICDYESYSLYEFEEHVEEHERELGAPQKMGQEGELRNCVVCGAECFAQDNSLGRDLQARPLCGICARQNVDSRRNPTHVTKETALEEVAYQCSDCDWKSFTSKEDLSVHFAREHSGGGKCSTCSKDFASAGKLEEHAIEHNAKVGELQCRFCLEEFKAPSLLTTHLDASHTDRSRCSLCGRRCASEGAILRHVVKCHLVPRLQAQLRGEPIAVGAATTHNMEDIIVICTEEVKKGVWEYNQKYACGVCGWRSKRRDQLNTHIGLHTTASLACPSCGMKFPSRAQLFDHLTVCYQMVGVSYCPHCFVECQPQDLSTHIRSDHAAIYKYLTCQECKEPCGSVGELREHTMGLHFAPQGSAQGAQHCLQIVIEDSSGGLLSGGGAAVVTAAPEGDDDDTENCSNNKKYTCKSCIFAGTKKEVERHECLKKDKVDKVEETDLKISPIQQLYCQLCEMSFGSETAYSRHQSVWHSSDKTCELCGKQFSLMNKFLFHKEYCHREELKCVFCSKQFEDVKKLKMHEYSHKRNVGKIYTCEECDKSFKTASGLRFHRLSHTGQYPFFCEYCGRGFVSTHHLDEHVAKHTGEHRFICDVCGKSFMLYDTYHRHRNLHDNPYPKQCTLCQAYFRNASRLAEHRRKVHTKERPYKCPHCPMTFNISSTYKVHLCIHTQKYPHNCTVCGRGFTTRIKYATHLATKHGDFSVLNDKKPNYRQVFPENYF